jgi:hypothetical protein
MRWRALASTSERVAAMAARFLRSADERGKEGGEWMGKAGTTAEAPFYALGSWPRRQVARGAWKTRGGDGLRPVGHAV